jgi:hypothetical protein
MELGFRYDANVTRNPLVFDGGSMGLAGMSMPSEVFVGFSYLLPRRLW